MNSMTGFGRAEGTIGQSRITVEVKSVNHRYLDTRFRIPPFLSPFELRMTEAIKERFDRGAFDISIRHKLNSGEGSLAGTQFIVDETAATSFHECATRLANKFGYPPPDLRAFLDNHRIVVPVEESADLEKAYPAVEKIFVEALDQLAAMRSAEGAKLKTILKSGLAEIASVGTKLETLAADQPKHIAEKLTKRVERWKLSPPIDQTRLEQEIALYAERSDFTEELDRLKTHERAFALLLDEKAPAGRRLDFLTQEFHREFNTLGSKAAHVEITKLALRGKSEVEKLRQQVQNVE